MNPKRLLFILSIIILVTMQSSIFSQGVHSQCRTGLNKYLGSHQTTKDSMLISTGGCLVLDVNVIIDSVLHGWVSNLRFYVQKQNTGVLIISWVGGAGDNFIHTKLDDSASTPIASGIAPFNGTYRPSNPLTVFNGIAADGYWKLVITDTAGGDTGTLKAWCLQFVLSCPTGGIEVVEIPNQYKLYQNYPNPFNPISKIKYGVPKNGYVKLSVYDEIGRLVAILEDGMKQANTYEVEFDATNLPSGVYYYKLEADGFSDTKKMVVVK